MHTEFRRRDNWEVNIQVCRKPIVHGNTRCIELSMNGIGLFNSVVASNFISRDKQFGIKDM
jgi:hypothetical protein